MSDGTGIFDEGVEVLVDGGSDFGADLRSLRDFSGVSGREVWVIRVEDDLVVRAGREGALFNFVRAGCVVVVFGV